MTDLKELGIAASKPMAVEQREHVTKDANDLDKVESIERVMSPDDDLMKDHTDYDRVDPDVAKYATEGGVAVSEEENRRLKKMINKRVLTVMVFTYFLQALDKGTMSFASIMNIRQDLHLVGQQVRNRFYHILYLC
jgi:hypothetical protein